MKLRTAVVVCAALLLVGGAGAQTKSVTFGLKGGVDLAQFVYDPQTDVPGLDRLLGFGGGLTLGINFASAVSFDIDGMYMMKGAHWEGTVQDVGTVKEDFKFGYAVISPVLRLRIPGQAVAPYVLGGGEVGYLLTAKEKVTHGSGSSGGELDIKDGYENLDYGFVLGAGLEIPSHGGGGFFAEARYSRGMVDIVKDSGGSTTLADNSSMKVMNEAVYFLAGIRF